MHFGRRQRRHVWLLLSATVGLFCVATVTANILETDKIVDLRSYKPLWLISLDLQSDDRSVRQKACRDLQPRIVAARQSTARDLLVIADRLIERCADRTQHVHYESIAVLVAMRDAGLVDDARWQKLLESIVADTALVVSRQVRQTEPIVLKFRTPPATVGPPELTNGLSASVRISFAFDEAPLATLPIHWRARDRSDSFPLRTAGMPSEEAVFTLSPQLFQDLQPGEHRLRLLFDICLFQDAFNQRKPVPFGLLQQEHVTAITVLPSSSRLSPR